MVNSLSILITFSGFILFQYYGYSIYCQPNMTRPWCKAAIPIIYGFVQRHYWNVGPLRYWTFSQLPNFIIAMPTIAICAYSCWKYFSLDWKRTLTLCLIRNSSIRSKSFISQDCLFPHFVLLLFLLIYTLITVHVQIMARLFSFQPALYWSCATLYMAGSPRCKRIVAGTHIGYALVGTVLFANYYPPA